MKHLLATSAIAMLTLVPGCRSKLELDKQVDGIVEALSACDHAALDAEIAPELASELDAKFDGMCETVQWFGALESRKQTGIHVSTGQSKGTYELDFENGELTLELVLADGKIVGFEFTGDDWKKAKTATMAAKYAEYKIYGFDWLDADGSPHAAGNKFAPGKVAYRIKVGGLDPADGRFNLRVTTRILDAQGKTLWQSPRPDELSFDQDEHGVAVSGHVAGSVTIPEPGTYQIEYEIEDVNAGKKLEYTQAVIIE
jgi:hypothetical protein